MCSKPKNLGMPAPNQLIGKPMYSYQSLVHKSQKASAATHPHRKPAPSAALFSLRTVTLASLSVSRSMAAARASNSAPVMGNIPAGTSSAFGTAELPLAFDLTKSEVSTSWQECFYRCMVMEALKVCPDPLYICEMSSMTPAKTIDLVGLNPGRISTGCFSKCHVSPTLALRVLFMPVMT